MRSCITHIGSIGNLECRSYFGQESRILSRSTSCRGGTLEDATEVVESTIAKVIKIECYRDNSSVGEIASTKL